MSHSQRKSMQMVLWNTSPLTHPPVMFLLPNRPKLSVKLRCTANSRMRSVIASAIDDITASVDNRLAKPPLLSPLSVHGVHWMLMALSFKLSHVGVER